LERALAVPEAVLVCDELRPRPGAGGKVPRGRDQSGLVTLPPHELPAPAVQPKQWRPVTMRRVASLARSKSRMWAGAPKPVGRSSIWLKSQSCSEPSQE